MLVDVALAALLVVWISLAVLKRPSLLFGLLLIVNVALEAVSIIFIEAGAYNIELGMTTYRLGVAWFLIICLLLFFAGYQSAVPEVKPGRKAALQIGAQARSVFVFIAVFFISLQALGVIIYGSPLLSGGTKVDLLNSNAIARYLGGGASYISLCAGFLYFQSKRRLSFLIFLAQLILLVLQGHKFTSLLLNVVAFFSPYIVAMERIKISPKRVLIVLGVLLMIMVAFYNVYNKGNQFSQELGISAVEAMFYRAFYLVGHTYWGMEYYREMGRVSFDFSNFWDAARSMVRLMNPDPNIEDSIERGTTFGMAFPGYLFYVAPKIFFLPLSVVFGYVAGKFVGYFSASLIQGKAIKSIILYVLMNHVHHIIIQGNFYKIVSLKVLVIVSALMCYYWLANTSRSMQGGRLL